MAGRKQHYIPRSFLRGFLSHKKKASEYVWVFPKGRPPYNPEIAGVSSERHFYSELPTDGQETLDGKITEYEYRFGEILSQLRETPPGDAVAPELAAEVIVHLIVRSAEMRNSLSDGLKGVLAKAFSIVTRPGGIRDLVGLESAEPDARFQSMMAKFIAGDRNLQSLGLPEQLLTRVAFIIAKEAVPRDLEVDPAITSRLAVMHHHAETFTRELHNKTLSKDLLPPERLAALTPLRWRVVNQPDLVLPDCLALGFKEDMTPQPLATMGETFVTVAMPLTKDLLLIGQREDAPMFFPEVFNLCATACSHDYFIASANTAENIEFAGRIGVWSRKFLYEALDELDKEYPSSKAPLEIADEVATTGEAPVGYPVNYQVSFSAWADEPTAHLVVERLKPLVAHIAVNYSLDLLDGMTFAMDYENALATMDRGYDAPPMRTASLGYGVGWSLPVDVLRDDVFKVRVVFRGETGQLLLSEDESGRTMAEKMVVFQLANVAFRGLVARAFDGYEPPEKEPWIEFIRKDLMGYAVSSYFAARESATFSPGYEQAGRELLSGAVASARQIIMDERLSYRFHGDLDKFLGIVRQQVSPIIKFAAELAGYMDGNGLPDKADPELKELLQQVNLGTWFDQFRLDLRAQFSEVRRWESVEAFQEINYHAERVLWAFGVFPWTTAEGLNRVDIPIVLDAGRLRQASFKRPFSFLRVLARGIWERVRKLFRN